MRTTRLFFAAALAFAFAPLAAAQELPKPGPEHERLGKLAGEWEVTGDGEGTNSSAMMLGGLWLETKFKGKFAGMDFEGRGLDTYDATKKKYVSVWVDSFGTSPLILEGTMDKEGKKLTMEGEGPGLDGATTKYKSVTEYTSDDSYTFTLSAGGQPMVTLKYTRKKAK